MGGDDKRRQPGEYRRSPFFHVEAEFGQERYHRCLATVEFVGGQCGPPGQEAVRDADDGLRVVALAVVDQDVMVGTAEAIFVQESVLAKPVVLRDGREHCLAGDIPKRHG